MKKFIYCLLPLMSLQLLSCSSEKAFGRVAFEEEKTEEEIIEVTGFKNKIAYVGINLDSVTCNTYNKKGLVVGSRLAQIKSRGVASTNNFTEYEYDKNGLTLSAKTTIYDEDGSVEEIDTRTSEYDEHGNPTKSIDSYQRTGQEASTMTALSSYTYDKNGNVIEYFANQFQGDNLTFKRINTYSYDKKQRLIEANAKAWGENDDFDDPEGYSQSFKSTHKYEGKNKIIDINESTESIGTPDETKRKAMRVCEYNSKHKLTHQVSYNYDSKNLEKVIGIAEDSYEYSSSGLEISYKSITTDLTSMPKINRVVSRNTTYCGSKNDKIETRITTTVSGSNIETVGVYNYYDSNWNVIKQERTKRGKNGYTIYYFEY